MGLSPSRAIAVLEDARKGRLLKSDALQIDRALVRAYLAADRPADVLPVADRILQATDKPNKALRCKMLALAELGRWDDLRKVLHAELEKPGHYAATEELLCAGIDAAGRFRHGQKRLLRARRAGKGLAGRVQQSCPQRRGPGSRRPAGARRRQDGRRPGFVGQCRLPAHAGRRPGPVGPDGRSPRQPSAERPGARRPDSGCRLVCLGPHRRTLWPGRRGRRVLSQGALAQEAGRRRCLRPGPLAGSRAFPSRVRNKDEGPKGTVPVNG